MVLNIFALLFVLGITFVNTIFGVYSGLINAFCAIVSLAVSLGFWEVLDRALTAAGLHPNYSAPCSIALSFVVTLFVLRALADGLIRGNVRVPMVVDWVGGGICGFVIAQVCVGMLVISFLMLPWGGRVAMYEPLERRENNQVDPETGRVQFTKSALWLRSDRFTIGLFNIMSGGALAGGTKFASVYPDFATWVFWTGNTVQPEVLTAPIVDKDGDGVKEGIRVDTWWEQKGTVKGRYRKLNPSKLETDPSYTPQDYKLAPGKRLLGVRMTLRRGAADREGTAFHRFRPTNIRVVGEARGEPRDYVPSVLGGADFKIGENLRIADPDNNFALIGLNDIQIDAYFEVDDAFQPAFVEYRRAARAALLPANHADKPPTKMLVAVDPSTGQPGDGGGGGRTGGPQRFIDTIVSDGTGPNDDLPFPMALDKIRLQSEIELSSDNLIVRGRLAADRAALTAADISATTVRKFKLPAGMKLFQLRCKPEAAKSIAGGALDFVGSVVNQYKAVDKTGDEYPLCGYFGIVKKGGQDYIEMFLTDDPSGSGFRGMLDFKEIKANTELKADDAVLCLMFFVPKGKSIATLKSSGGTIDLGQEYFMPNE